MRGPKIGDVVEFEAPGGLVHAQLANRNREYGELLRVFPGVRAERPPPVELARQREQFVTFFPLGAAIRRGLARVVGNAPVPEQLRALPTFRMQGAIDPDGTTRNWWLWDGNREVFVDQLNEQQRDLPLLEVINDTLLVERVVEGWNPSHVR